MKFLWKLRLIKRRKGIIFCTGPGTLEYGGLGRLNHELLVFTPRSLSATSRIKLWIWTNMIYFQSHYFSLHDSIIDLRLNKVEVLRNIDIFWTFLKLLWYRLAAVNNKIIMHYFFISISWCGRLAEIYMDLHSM